MTLKSFLLCLGRHDDFRSRNLKGELVDRCLTCGREKALLQSEIVVGPQHQPARVYGEPKMQAMPEKVTKLKRERSA